MTIRVVTGFPHGDTYTVNAMATDPRLALIRWLPRLSMAVIDCDDDYAQLMRDEKYEFFDARETRIELLTVPPSAVTGSIINQRLDVDSFHALGITGAGVKVAVVDAGVRATHEALQGKVIVQYDHSGDGIGYTGEDHGTAMAGVIIGDNLDEGISGVAPGVTYGDFKFIRDSFPGETYEHYITALMTNALVALEAAAQLGYHIISCSWVDVLSMAQGRKWHETPVGLAVGRLCEQGILIVAASGNSDSLAPEGYSNVGVPANVPLVVAVGAIARSVVSPETWFTADFSSKGPTIEGIVKPDISAVGQNVRYLLGSGDNEYNVGDGTSFACPMVAGLAALVFQSIGRVDVQYFKDTLNYRAVPL